MTQRGNEQDLQHLNAEEHEDGGKVETAHRRQDAAHARVQRFQQLVDQQQHGMAVEWRNKALDI